MAQSQVPPAGTLSFTASVTFRSCAAHPILPSSSQTALELGYAGLALTDECSVAGIVRAHAAAKDLPLKLVVGSEVMCVDGLKVVVLAEDRRAYSALCALITQARRAAAKGEYCISRDDLHRHLQSNGLLLWLPEATPQQERARLGHWLKERFDGRLWMAVELLNAGNDRPWLKEVEALGAELCVPLVAAGNVHMHSRERRMLQDTLTAIRQKTPIEKIGTALHSNAERRLRPMRGARQALSAAVAARDARNPRAHRFLARELRYEYPHELVPQGETPASHLRSLTERVAAGAGPGASRQKFGDSSSTSSS